MPHEMQSFIATYIFIRTCWQFTIGLNNVVAHVSIIASNNDATVIILCAGMLKQKINMAITCWYWITNFLSNVILGWEIFFAYAYYHEILKYIIHTCENEIVSITLKLIFLSILKSLFEKKYLYICLSINGLIMIFNRIWSSIGSIIPRVNDVSIRWKDNLFCNPHTEF